MLRICEWLEKYNHEDVAAADDDDNDDGNDDDNDDDSDSDDAGHVGRCEDAGPSLGSVKSGWSLQHHESAGDSQDDLFWGQFFYSPSISMSWSSTWIPLGSAST